jgi:signal peptidase I
MNPGLLEGSLIFILKIGRNSIGGKENKASMGGIGEDRA